jgi:Xaa-Pro aminopeptidase
MQARSWQSFDRKFNQTIVLLLLEKLTHVAYRKQDLFAGLSFDTISATGPNGAIIHYSPDPHNSAVIDADNVGVL